MPQFHGLLAEIADQAAATRRLQKAYLKARTQTALKASARAEHVLDLLIARRAAQQAQRQKEIYKQERFTHEVIE